MITKPTIAVLIALVTSAPAVAQDPDAGRESPRSRPRGTGPAGAGPVGPGPIGAGPMGPGSIGPGPIGMGPIDPGLMALQGLEALHGAMDALDRLELPRLMSDMRSLDLSGLRSLDLSALAGDLHALGLQGRERPQRDREQELRDREQEQREREQERRERDREREAEAYDEGHDAMGEGRWDRAVTYFDRVLAMNGPHADAALYWKAFSQNRIGQRAEALATLGELSKAHPNSRYVKQAKALEVEMRGAAGQQMPLETQADEEMKLLALQALQNSDPEQAIPPLRELLDRATASPRLKSRALFVLAQSNSPRALEVLKNIAKGSSTPELQSKAIQYLGVHGGRESRAVLGEIYDSGTDIDVKRRILRAFMVSGERARVLAAAQKEQNPDLRAEAVQLLGTMGASEELWQLYQKEGSIDVKKRILSAMFVGGNATRLIDLAKSEQNADLRRIAIRNLGHMGSKRTGDALVEIYGGEKDAAVKKSAINGLFVQNNATALIALARKENDIEMKKEIVSRLSNMHDPAITAYMAELLKSK
jgi:HEAT repeat protein